MIRSVHVWGFFDSEGMTKLPEGAAVSEMTVEQMHNRVVGNITRHGGKVTNLQLTHPIGKSMLFATEFTTPARGDEARAMWHQISLPREVWPA